MFGHQDDKHDESPQEDTAATLEITPDEQAGGAPDTGSAGHHGHAAPTDDGGTGTPADTNADDSVIAPDHAAPQQDDDAWQHPGVPIDDGPEHISDVIAPAGGSAPSYKPHPLGGSDHSFSDDTNDNVPHELIDIKQKALSKLTPLIDQLDQSPEDKFRTTMMMIQASDDQSLVKLAYEAADKIEDEKARAQALLDIVNEINYFTQHPEN